MAEETTVATEPAGAESGELTTKLGDAFGEVLDRTFGQLGDAPEPGKSAAEPAPAKPAETEPVKPAEPAPPAEADELTPPASVLGKEEPAQPASTDPMQVQLDEKYGVIPEKPGRGFKNKEEEVSWGKFRGSHEELKKDLAAIIRKQQEAPPVDEKFQAQYEQVLAQNQQYAAIIEQVAVERLPQVQEMFDKPRAQKLERIRSVLESEEIEPDSIDRLLAAPAKQRVKMQDQLLDSIESKSARGKVERALDEIEEIDTKRTEFLTDRKGNAERIIQQNKAAQFRQVQEQEQKIVEALDMISADVSKNFAFAAKSGKPGYEKWDARVQGRFEKARELATKGRDPMVMLEAITKGQFLDDYDVALRRTLNRAEKAEARIKELEGALPSSSPTRTPTGERANGAPSDQELGILDSDDFGKVALKTLDAVHRGV